MSRTYRQTYKVVRKQEIFVKDKSEYTQKIKNRVNKLNFNALAKQLEPFLFKKDDFEIIKKFPDYVDDLLKII